MAGQNMQNNKDLKFRMEHPEHQYHPQFIDYSEKRSLPITVPDYRHIQQVNNNNIANALVLLNPFREPKFSPLGPV